MDTIIQENILRSARSLIDIGCGTGVLGLALAKRHSSIVKLIAADVVPLALACFGINAYINGISTPYQVMYANSEYPLCDISIVTPFYFPIEKKLNQEPNAAIIEIVNNASDMIVAAIHSASKATYFVYSSVTENEIRKQVGIDWEVIADREVPFSIGDNVGCTELVSRAKSDGRLIIREKDGFNLYHVLYVAVVRK